MKTKILLIVMVVIFLPPALTLAGDYKKAHEYINSLKKLSVIDNLEVGDDQVWVWWNQSLKRLTYNDKITVGNCFSAAYPGKICVINDAHTNKELIFVTHEGTVIAR
jgi:hypothetical protein